MQPLNAVGIPRLSAREDVKDQSLTLANKGKPLQYQFDGFTFVSRRVARGSRLRLVFAPVNSIYAQKNHNSWKEVANESADDSRQSPCSCFTMQPIRVSCASRSAADSGFPLLYTCNVAVLDSAWICADIN
jgi:hypothetical protein